MRGGAQFGKLSPKNASDIRNLDRAINESKHERAARRIREGKIWTRTDLQILYCNY